MTAIAPDFIAQLRCPQSGARLWPLGASQWSELVGSMKSPNGLSAESPEKAPAGLVCQDGSAVYPVRDGIPILLSEERIELSETAQESARRWLRERGCF